MLKNKLFLALSLLCFVTFSGCDSDEEEVEGKWDPIQITINGNKCKSSTFKVPVEGGGYKIYSNNYGELWLNSVEENVNTVWPEDYDWSDYKNIHLTGEWYEIQYDDNGNIVANISSKEKTTPSRNLTFHIEVGDAFGYVTLLQE